MTKLLPYLAAVALLAGAALPAHAQQAVETDTGKHAAGYECGVSQAMLAELEAAQTEREAETRERLNALLDSALARSFVSEAVHSSVVFPPARPGS